MKWQDWAKYVVGGLVAGSAAAPIAKEEKAGSDVARLGSEAPTISVGGQGAQAPDATLAQRDLNQTTIVDGVTFLPTAADVRNTTVPGGYPDVIVGQDHNWTLEPTPETPVYNKLVDGKALAPMGTFDTVVDHTNPDGTHAYEFLTQAGGSCETDLNHCQPLIPLASLASQASQGASATTAPGGPGVTTVPVIYSQSPYSTQSGPGSTVVTEVGQVPTNTLYSEVPLSTAVPPASGTGQITVPQVFTKRPYSTQYGPTTVAVTKSAQVPVSTLYTAVPVATGTQPAPGQSQDQGGGLSTGAKAGIGVGAGVAGIAAIGGFALYAKQQRGKTQGR